jgi:preprotein translocase subunit SecD
VELDYKVDFEEARSKSGITLNENTVIEGLKTIIDKRVNSLGLAEPTISSAKYGDESHIIVQIPTQNYGNISESEREIKSNEDIKRAKETIGKVVKLEFKEER